MHTLLAQVSRSSGTGHWSGTGDDIAEWADSPEKLILVWVIGGAILIGVIALLVKMKMDKD
jgi:hypothetical protein